MIAYTLMLISLILMAIGAFLSIKHMEIWRRHIGVLLIVMGVGLYFMLWGLL